MLDSTKFIIKRVIIGVLIAIIVMLIKKNCFAQTISNFNFDTWQYVYQDHTGTTFDNTYTYRTGTGNLLAINVYYPTFEGYYLGNVKLTVNSNFYNPPVNNLYPMNFGFYVKENGAYNSNVRTSVSCSGNTCTYDFVGYQKQTSNQVLELQLLIDSNYGFFYPPSFRLSSTIDYDDSSSSISSSDFNNGVNNIIINNDNNTQTIINNNNDNTQDIIDNQNENTDKTIESQQVCSDIDKTNIFLDNKELSSIGTELSNLYTGITDYLNINNSSLTVLLSESSGVFNSCFYNINKELISCTNIINYSNSELPIPDNSYYFRATIRKSTNKPTFRLCRNGNQALQDSLNDNDTSQANNDAVSFFGNFNVGDDSLSGIITAPIRFLNSLTGTCSPVSLSLYNETITIPCGTTIFWDRQDVQTFRTFWNILFGGSIIYLLSLKLYKVVHNAFDPDKDSIETVGV